MHLHVCLLLSLMCVSTLAATSYKFGTYERPFSADSPWNSKPVNPVFADAIKYRVNTSDYYPALQEGTWSTGVFLADATDPPVTVIGIVAAGLWNVDAGEFQPNITIPRWPAETLPAAGSDGHCDMVDPITGVLHSFWELRQINGSWYARQYAWSFLDGLGWGDPAHYYQGARAAGVPPSGGIIRKHEVNDGTNVYPHALCMSLTYNSLGKDGKGFVYPATSADGGFLQNTGYIPEGALLMLPPDYNYSNVASFQLRKIAETLKTYGAYVVDRNIGTPYVIYIENGANLTISNVTGWDNAAQGELQRIRANLRMVNTSLTSFVDGNGKPLKARTNVNLLSMRGPNTWDKTYGDGTARFDTWTQHLMISESKETTNFQNTNGLGYNRVYWATLKDNQTYNFTAFTTGEAKIGINVMISNSSKTVLKFNSGWMTTGMVTQFTLPERGYVWVMVTKPAGPAGSVRGMLYIPDGTGIPTEHPLPNAPTSAPTTKPTNAPTTKPTTAPPTGSATTSATATPTTGVTPNPTAGPTAAPGTTGQGNNGATTGEDVGSGAVNLFALPVTLVLAMLVLLA